MVKYVSKDTKASGQLKKKKKKDVNIQVVSLVVVLFVCHFYNSTYHFPEYPVAYHTIMALI